MKKLKHKLFRYNIETDKLEPSTVVFYEKDLKLLSKIIFYTFRKLQLINVTEKKDIKSGNICFESSNFTLINFYLIWAGPTKEDKLTFNLLIVQVN
jgi:hypothetical protein